jgi:hypothetical protein
MEPHQPDAQAEGDTHKSEKIYWELKTPEALTGDEDIFFELYKWLTQELGPRVRIFGVDIDEKGKYVRINDWVLLIGQYRTLDLARRRSSGILDHSTGHLPIFFLLALKSWFKEEQWKNALTLAYEDATTVGSDIRGNQKLLEHFGFTSIDDVRDEAEAFGLIQERIKFEDNLSDDWF